MSESTITAEKVAAMIKEEITAMVSTGDLPRTIDSFGLLHDFCDANCLGPTESRMENLSGSNWNTEIEILSKAQDIVHEWLRGQPFWRPYLRFDAYEIWPLDEVGWGLFGHLKEGGADIISEHNTEDEAIDALKKCPNLPISDPDTTCPYCYAPIVEVVFKDTRPGHDKYVGCSVCEKKFRIYIKPRVPYTGPLQEESL